MLLESYFNFINETCIRIQGTRVGIETVVEDYAQGAGPEEIILRYPTLSLEQVHAVILYYLANQVDVERYIERVHQQREEAYVKWLQDPEGGASEFVRELRERFAKHKAKMNSSKSESVAHEASVLAR